MSASIKHSSFFISGIDHIIFDKDGTLTDSHLYWSAIIKLRSEVICQYFKLDPDKYLVPIQKQLGLSSSNRLSPEGPIGLKSRQYVVNHVVAFLDAYSIATDFSEIDHLFQIANTRVSSLSNSHIRLLPDVLDFLNKCLDSNILLSLATSDSYENTTYVLSHLGLNSFFGDCIVCGDSGFGEKTSGQPAKHLCSLHDCSTLSTISIGDAPMDRTMALNGDLNSHILVSTGQLSFSSLVSVSPHVCNNLSELMIY